MFFFSFYKRASKLSLIDFVIVFSDCFVLLKYFLNPFSSEDQIGLSEGQSMHFLMRQHLWHPPTSGPKRRRRKNLPNGGHPVSECQIDPEVPRNWAWEECFSISRFAEVTFSHICFHSLVSGHQVHFDGNVSSGLKTLKTLTTLVPNQDNSVFSLSMICLNIRLRF